jgi:hypothetical protein
MHIRLLAVLSLALCACDSPRTQETFTVRAESLLVSDSTLRYTARLAYPQIDGSAPGLERANRVLADSARAVVGLYRPPEAPPPDLAATFEASAEGGFETSLLRDSIYSALLETYAYTGGAHGIHDLRGLNVDLRTGEPITLSQFFANDTSWADTLAARATGKLERALGPDVLFEGRVPAEPASFRVFTLTADSLVITFPPYAVAPYAAGPQRVAFAWTALRPMLDPTGPAQYFLRPASENER